MADAIRDALDIDVTAWLLDDPATGVATPRSAEARMSSEKREEIVGPEGEHKSRKWPLAPATSPDAGDGDSENAGLGNRQEESEFPSADQGVPAVAEDAPLAAPSLAEDSNTEPLACTSSWSRACDSYFSGDWEADLPNVVLAAAGIAIVLGGCLVRKGQKGGQGYDVENLPLAGERPFGFDL